MACMTHLGSSTSGVDTISYILVSGYGSGGDIGFVVFSWNGGSSWRKNHLIILHIPGLENCREKTQTTENLTISKSHCNNNIPASDALPRLQYCLTMTRTNTAEPHAKTNSTTVPARG